MNAALKRALFAVALAQAAESIAQEGRTFSPIARPVARPVLPGGAVRVSPPQPLPRDRIEAAVATVAGAWSERNVGAVLAPEFPRRRELVDALQTKVPRDAGLRVIAIQSWRVLDQYRLSGNLVSKVSVTVSTQVEFNDPVAGYQVRGGINEYVLTLTDRDAP